MISRGFFFSSRRRHTRCGRDWSSDVCSSDLGWTLIDPDDRPRLTALAEEGRRTVVIVVGLILTFAVAGAIEGFVTGRPWPTALRVGIGGLVEIAFLAYALTLGRGAAARGLTGALGERDEGGWLVPARDPTPRAT